MCRMHLRQVVMLGIHLSLRTTVDGSQTMAESIDLSAFVYWPGHYLQGQPLRPGSDIFGMDYQARTSKGLHWNHTMCWKGFPPYEGDDQAYFERLAAEGYARNASAAQRLAEAQSEWAARTWRAVYYCWNEAYGSARLDLDGDGCLDWHPFSPMGPGSSILGPGFRGSGAASEGYWTNLWSMGPGDEQPGSMYITFAAVPLDAVQTEVAPGFRMWFQSDGVVIGWDWGPLTEGMDDCWAVVRRRCSFKGVTVNEYQSPSHWGTIAVREEQP